MTKAGREAEARVGWDGLAEECVPLASGLEKRMGSRPGGRRRKVRALVTVSAWTVLWPREAGL